MSGWLRKKFGRKEERETPTRPPPDSSSTPSTAHNPNRSTSSGRMSSSSTDNASNSTGRPRVSTHDIAMAASTLGVVSPLTSNRLHESATGGQPPGSVINSNDSISNRQDIRQQQIDADLAMAYSLAQQDGRPTQSTMSGYYLPPLGGVPQTHPRPPPPSRYPLHTTMPMTSPFGDAVSLPPPPSGAQPDLAMAAALAESEFSARQADELKRATEAVYQEAVNRALEASLHTVDYDYLLRDIKMWIIDLAAATDDVVAALDDIVKRREEVDMKLERAIIEKDEKRKIKYGWLADQLPRAEEKLRNLADKITPIGVAVVELQDLRDHILSTSPPINQSQKERDGIISRMFKAMESCGLRWDGRNPNDSNKEGGPSTSSSQDQRQAPSNLRDLITSSILDAQKIPKMPSRRKSSSSLATTITATSVIDDADSRSQIPTPPSVDHLNDHTNDHINEHNQEPSAPYLDTPDVIPLLTTALTLNEESRAYDRNMSNSDNNNNNSNYTIPVPFQLSTSRWRPKSGTAPQQIDTLRRIPALISLHYELRKDSGVVAETVAWNDGPGYRAELGPVVSAPAPLKRLNTTFDSAGSMVNYVRENGGFPTIVPCKFESTDRWSVMCAGAGVHEALVGAARDLSQWAPQPGSSAAAECHRLVDYLARINFVLSTVAHAHDPLRQALTKHRLPWNDNAILLLRWSAQHAAIVTLNLATEASEDAERVKGPWQRQAVLKPLGHGVMAAFTVHQFCGGFAGDAATVCDYLIERTVHYARLIDPKWFRGHKVVS